MELTETNNIVLTQEQIDKIKKAVAMLKDVWNSIVEKVKDIVTKITKIWNEFLLKVYSNNKIIKKLNYIYFHTRNKRIKKKQITRLYKILKE